ncbi:hypothetical protein FRC06_009452, partial [Ceratobasidium sp. 370]
MDSDNDEICPCCQKILGRRQFARHRIRYLQRLKHNLALEQPNSNGPALGDNDPALGDNGPGPGGNDDFAPELAPQAQDEVEPAPGGGDAFLLDLMDELNAAEAPLGSPDAMSISDGDPPMFALPPEPERAHQVYRNPPVTIDEWPDPNDNPDPSETSDDDNRSAAGEDRDPAYVEQADAPGFNPDDEPLMDDEQLAAFLQMHLGDLAEEEWIDLFPGSVRILKWLKLDDRYLSNKDRTTLQFLTTRLRTHFSRETYNELRHSICAPLGIPSEVVAWCRLRILSGLETHAYDCCINSCLCYLGKYQDLTSCLFCKEPRYNAAGKARRTYHYAPLIPQLHGLFQTPEMIEKLCWRAKSEEHREPGKFEDVYDGEHYRQLRETEVHE